MLDIFSVEKKKKFSFDVASFNKVLLHSFTVRTEPNHMHTWKVQCQLFKDSSHIVLWTDISPWKNYLSIKGGIKRIKIFDRFILSVKRGMLGDVSLATGICVMFPSGLPAQAISNMAAYSVQLEFNLLQ